jgi:hypothetical protein
MTTELTILLSVMWVSTLGFAAYMVYLFKVQKNPYKEVEQLRSEMNALAMSVGLRKAQGPQGPPTMGIR